jgi:hypothetical protein
VPMYFIMRIALEFVNVPLLRYVHARHSLRFYFGVWGSNPPVVSSSLIINHCFLVGNYGPLYVCFMWFS